MCISPKTKGWNPRELGRLIRRASPPPSQPKEAVVKPSEESVVEDPDFSHHDEIIVEEEDTSVSISLYEQAVADCFDGVIIRNDPALTHEENAHFRNRKAQAFVNTLVVLSNTVIGPNEVVIKDKSRPKKSVRFADNLVRGPGKEYNAIAEETDDDEDKTTHCGGFMPYSDAETESDPGSIEPSGSDTNPLPPPNIVEKIFLCDCPSHTHCLTCQLNNEAFSLVVKDSYADITDVSSARWVVALTSLDRAIRVWVAEHVLNNPNIGPDGWQTPTDKLDKATLTTFRDMISISHDLALIRDKGSRYVSSSMRKLNKLTDNLKKVKNQIMLQDLQPQEELTPEVEILSQKFFNLKGEIKMRLNRVIDLLNKLNDNINVFLSKRIAQIRKDMLRNFEQTNVQWPKSSLRKLEFMAEVLVNVYKDSREFAIKLKAMYAIWDTKIKDGRAGRWYRRVRGFISSWEEWTFDLRRALAPVTHRAEVLDRRWVLECPEKGCTRKVRRVKGQLLKG